MIDTRSQYMIYKGQENERMAQIERRLAAQESNGCLVKDQPVYFAAEQWLKQNVFSRIFAKPAPVACERPC